MLWDRASVVARSRDSPMQSGSSQRPSYAVGVVNYRTYGDLERCLGGIKAQTVAPLEVSVVDADGERDRLAELQRTHPEIAWDSQPNRGFSAGANRILAGLRDRCVGVDFVLLLNPDVVLEPDFVEMLLADLAEQPSVALASGKLLRPGGCLDSAGIELPRNRRPRDRGSERPDDGQYDRAEFVFGASGAALMIRWAALESLAVEGEIFDEDFFLYHEDTDLSWRANLLGWRVRYVPDAIAVHGRRWRQDKRFQMDVEVRRHSFKNHYLQIIKNERARDFALNLPILLGWEVLRLGFALLRDPAMLPGYREAWRLRRRAWHKRRIIQPRARAPRSSTLEPRARGEDAPA